MMNSHPMAALLKDRRDVVLDAWVRHLELPQSIQDLPHHERVDAFPGLYDELCDVVERRLNTADAAASFEAAKTHAHHRRSAQIPISDVTVEFSLLRSLLIALVQGERTAATTGELDVLHRALDDAMVASISAHLEDVAREDRRERDRFRLALGRGHTAVFEQDSELRYTWVYNPQAGFRDMELLGKRDRDVIADAQVAVELEAFKRRALESGERAQMSMVMAAGGGDRHFAIEVEPRRDDSGAVCGLVGAAADITEPKRLEQALRDALQFREDVLAIVSHDLRNPLNALAMGIDVIATGSSAVDQARVLARMQSALSRAARLVDSILDYARTQQGQSVPLERQEVRLAPLLREAVDEVRDAYPLRVIELELGAEPILELDPDRFTQAAVNLIVNAAQHGDPSAAVTVALRQDDQRTLLSVHNRGRPIPPHVQTELFLPFRRGESSGEREGIGLGLFIARQVIEAHGGTIALHSTETDGTTFTIELP